MGTACPVPVPGPLTPGRLHVLSHPTTCTHNNKLHNTIPFENVSSYIHTDNHVRIIICILYHYLIIYNIILHYIIMLSNNGGYSTLINLH